MWVLPSGYLCRPHRERHIVLNIPSSFQFSFFLSPHPCLPLIQSAVALRKFPLPHNSQFTFTLCSHFLQLPELLGFLSSRNLLFSQCSARLSEPRHIIVEGSDSQTGDFWPTGERYQCLEILEIFLCYWHLTGRDQVLLDILQGTGQPPRQRITEPNVNSAPNAKAAKPWLRAITHPIPQCLLQAFTQKNQPMSSLFITMVVGENNRFQQRRWGWWKGMAVFSVRSWNQ